VSKGVVLVTGGGRGIGAATARLAAAAGYVPVIVYKSRDEDAARLVAEIGNAGYRALPVRADVAREEDILSAFAMADAAGRLVGLVNNAGTTGGQSTVMNVRSQQVMSALTLNVFGAFVCAREAVRRMARSKGGQGGAIVNVSSAAARTGSPNFWVHYAASKAALDTLTIGLAKEVAADGIRVNAVRPGVIDTEIHAANPPDLMERMKQAIPMRRMGDPDEVARSIVWLLSEEASYVTGSILDVGGGY
jgi:NAD(P)-dependent dehydrogenase (short-subunit alcohol dehydrogenase family)